MKNIKNISNILIDNTIEKTQKMCEKGVYFDAFLFINDYIFRSGAVNDELYDIERDLLRMVSDDELQFMLLSKKAAYSFHKKQYTRIVRDLLMLADSMYNLEKYDALHCFLKEYNLERSFYSRSKAGTKKIDKWHRDDLNDIDKIDFSAYKLMVRMNENDKIEEIIQSNFVLHEDSVFYEDCRMLLAQSYMYNNQYEKAIQIAKSINVRRLELEKNILILKCYEYLKKNKASMFFYNKLLYDAQYIATESDKLLDVFQLLIDKQKDAEIYEITSFQLKHSKLDFRYLYNNIISSYNIGKTDALDGKLKHLFVSFPSAVMLKMIIEDDRVLGIKKLPYIQKISNELIARCEYNKDNLNQNSVQWQESVMVLTIANLLTVKEMAESAKQSVAYTNFLKNMLVHPAYTNEQKTNITQALFFAGEKYYCFTKNYYPFYEDFLDLEKLNRYGNELSDAYALVLGYVITKLHRKEMVMTVINFATEFFINSLNSENIKKIKSESEIASIILTIYLYVCYQNINKKIYTGYDKIPNNFIDKFNIFAKPFGLQIIDEKIYKNDQEVDLVKSYSTYMNGGKNT